MSDIISNNYFKFDNNTVAYNSDNALLLAKASNLAYQFPGEVSKVTKEIWGYNRFAPVKNSSTDTQAFVIANESNIIISFRGTEGKLRDWVTDADTRLIPFSDFGGDAHEGFLKALDSVWGEIEMTVKNFRTHNQPVWICGHSLGAALAALATARFFTRGIIPNGLYTFGQPRTGDKKFAAEFDARLKKQSFRFVNNNDVVTRIPPAAFGFEHIGTFLYFTENGELKKSLTYWENFWDKIEGQLRSFLDLKFDDIDDHKISNYIKLIAGKVK